MNNLIAYLVGTGILLLIVFVVFYPTFEEWYTKLWEEIDRIKEKIKRKFEEETEEAW